MVSPSGTPCLRMAQCRQSQRQTEILALEAGLLEERPQGGAQRRLAVDVVNRQLATAGVLGDTPQRGQRKGRVVLERRESGDAARLTTAFDIQDGLAVDGDEIRAGDALETAGAWPSQGCTERISRIGRAQHLDNRR